MIKFYKIIISSLIIFLILFCFYVYELHALAVEGNKIFERRCLVVNPLLIAYKNSFLSFADALKNPNKYTSEEGKGFYMGYINGMKDYKLKEDSWIASQEKYMNSLEYQLLMPWYMKKGSEYEVGTYKGYRDEARYLLESVETGKMTQEMNDNFLGARKRRSDFVDKYNDFYDNFGKYIDWRMKFISLPAPVGCTPENQNIPDTSGELNPSPEPIKNPGITG